MSLTMKTVTADKVTSGSHRADRPIQRTSLRRNRQLYFMIIPGLILILIFGYGPLFSLSIAFQDFSPYRGIFSSTWIGLENFKTAFQDPFFWRAFRNSAVISVLKLVIGFPSAIILALLLNEIRVKWFKRLVQTGTILPFFISWVVAAAMFQNLLAPQGTVNSILNILHLSSINFLSDPEKFLWVVVLQDTWKYAGYFAVIYLAAMSAIDPALYEAAIVDGANRWRQIRYITIPGITTTMVTLFVLLTGYLISAGFEQVYVMYNVSVYPTADILETYTLRIALGQGNFSLATAIGLFQSVISLTLVLIANFLAKRFNKRGLF